MIDSAVVAKRRPISKIWLVPLLAALIGAWMVYQYLDQKGELITITMSSAEGVIPGKTAIKTRNVPIGTIVEIHLAADRKNVVATAQIDKPYRDLLTDDAQIWAVQPRIDLTGISGLDTLLSGIYFEFQPGTSPARGRAFQLLAEPPLVARNVPGKRFRLSSHNAEVMAPGTPVRFKGYEVGTVETARFDWVSQAMHYQVFIADPNSNLVTENTLFWVEAGIELELSAAGIDLKSGPLVKLLRGAITFAVPEREPRGEIAPEGSTFTLGRSFRESLDARYPDVEYYVVTLGESIRGLQPGAPVEYRGVRVGTVVDAPLRHASNGDPVSVPTERGEIPVLIKIEFQRTHSDVAQAKSLWQAHFGDWLQRGLRASLQTGSLLTGAQVINLDFYDVEAIDLVPRYAGYPQIPTTTAGFSRLSRQVSKLLDKLNGLKVEQTLAGIDATLASLSELAQSTDQLVGGQETRRVPQEINRSLRDLQQALQAFQPDSALYTELEQALQGVARLATEIRPLARSLNEHPNSLIFDRPPQEDIQPTRRKPVP